LGRTFKGNKKKKKKNMIDLFIHLSPLGLNQNEYIMATEKAVQPFVIKQAVSMPPMALSQMPYCKIY
jgi:hypothetical protein